MILETKFEQENRVQGCLPKAFFSAAIGRFYLVATLVALEAAGVERGVIDNALKGATSILGGSHALQDAASGLGVEGQGSDLLASLAVDSAKSLARRELDLFETREGVQKLQAKQRELEGEII